MGSIERARFALHGDAACLRRPANSTTAPPTFVDPSG
jgi:hypothetical protein